MSRNLKNKIDLIMDVIFFFISECGNPNMTLPDLPPDFNCVMYPNCSSVQCCVYVKFLKRNVHLSMDLDICSRKISYAVEKLKKELVFDSKLGTYYYINLCCVFKLGKEGE